jgi:urease accessory protein
MSLPGRSTRWFALALLLALLLPSIGRAHANPSMGFFYGGLLQPFYHLESLLLLIAMALRSAQFRSAEHALLPLVFGAACLVGAALGLVGMGWSLPPWFVGAAALTVALGVVARLPLPPHPSLAAAALLGLVQGQFAAFEDRSSIPRPILYALGIGVAPLVLAGAAEALAQRFPGPVGQIALRVGGSWIAAVALLVVALVAIQR